MYVCICIDLDWNVCNSMFKDCACVDTWFNWPCVYMWNGQGEIEFTRMSINFNICKLLATVFVLDS